MRERDIDAFLCGLFAPEQVREPLYALEAFDIEVRRIRSTVSEPLLGQIRLQWWRQVVEDAHGASPPSRHPVADALADVIRRHGLPREALDRILNARAKDLEPTLPDSLDTAIEMAAAVGESLANLRLAVLAIDHDPTWQAVRSVSRARVLVNLAARGGEPGAPRAEDLSRHAADHLDSARVYRDCVRREAIPLLLPAVLMTRDLRRFMAAGHDPEALRTPAGGARRMMSLWWHARRGRF